MHAATDDGLSALRGRSSAQALRLSSVCMFKDPHTDGPGFRMACGFKKVPLSSHHTHERGRQCCKKLPHRVPSAARKERGKAAGAYAALVQVLARASSGTSQRCALLPFQEHSAGHVPIRRSRTGPSGRTRFAAPRKNGCVCSLTLVQKACAESNSSPPMRRRDCARAAVEPCRRTYNCPSTQQVPDTRKGRACPVVHAFDSTARRSKPKVSVSCPGGCGIDLQ